MPIVGRTSFEVVRRFAFHAEYSGPDETFLLAPEWGSSDRLCHRSMREGLPGGFPCSLKKFPVHVEKLPVPGRREFAVETSSRETAPTAIEAAVRETSPARPDTGPENPAILRGFGDWGQGNPNRKTASCGPNRSARASLSLIPRWTVRIRSGFASAMSRANSSLRACHSPPQIPSPRVLLQFHPL